MNRTYAISDEGSPTARTPLARFETSPAKGLRKS